MKKIGTILIVALLVFACNSSGSKTEQAATKQEVSTENLTEVSIPVVGMTCEGCENAVMKSIGTLEGIADVAASHTDSIATVKYDTTAVTIEEIEFKIAEAGYTVAN